MPTIQTKDPERKAEREDPQQEEEEDAFPLMLRARPRWDENDRKQAATQFDRFANSREPLYSRNANTQLDRDIRRIKGLVRKTIRPGEEMGVSGSLEAKQDEEEIRQRRDFQEFESEMEILAAAMAAEWLDRFFRLNLGMAEIVVISFNSEFDTNIRPTSEQVRQAARRRARLLGNRVSATNFNAAIDQVMRGLINGESLNRITRRIQSLADEGLFREAEDGTRFRVLNKEQRSRLVARTETAAIANDASLAAAMAAPMDLTKEWVTQQDERVRDAHRAEAADQPSQGLPLDQAFPVTGMQFPHAVNERCFLVFHEVNDENEE